MNEIVVISSYPERDIQEFITYFKPYIDKYKYPKLYLKDGHILRFQSNNNLIGVRKHYYYSEIFKSYSRSCITILQQEIERLNNKIKEQNLLLIEFQDMEQKVNIYKSRCRRANKIITDFMCTEEYCNVDPVAIAENYMEIQKSLNGSDNK